MAAQIEVEVATGVQLFTAVGRRARRALLPWPALLQPAGAGRGRAEPGFFCAKVKPFLTDTISATMDTVIPVGERRRSRVPNFKQPSFKLPSFFSAWHCCAVDAVVRRLDVQGVP